MKLFLLYFLFFLGFTSFSYGSNSKVKAWEKVNLPSFFSNIVYLDVQFLNENPNYGWVCGFESAILFTKDAGKTWETRQLNIGGIQLESIHFVDSLIGYCSGTGTNSFTSRGFVYKSTDGGNSWFNVTPQHVVINDITLWGCYFLDKDNGIALGGECGTNQFNPGSQDFYRTTNGGSSWSLYTIQQSGSKLSDAILKPSGQKSYAVGSGRLFISTDGGFKWSNFVSTTGNEFTSNNWHEEITNIGESFLLPVSGGCGGTTNNDGGMTMTTDNGNTWIEKRFNSAMFGSFLTSPTSGWAVGYNRAIYYTSDAGVNWELRNYCIDDRATLDDIWCVDDTTVWVVGNGVYKLIEADTTTTWLKEIEYEICKGDRITLATPDTLNKFKYNEWTTGDYTKSIEVNKEGTYNLLVYNNYCFEKFTQSFKVKYKPEAELDIRSTKFDYCEGDNAIIHLEGNDTLDYVWNTGETSKTITVNQSGIYSVTSIDEYLCPVTKEIEIKFHPKPIPTIAMLTSNNLCIGDTVVLAGENGDYQYEWYNQNSNVISNERVLVVTQSGEYTLELFNKFGCSELSQSVNVIIRNDTNRLVLNITEDVLEIQPTLYPFTNCRKLSITNNNWQYFTLNSPKFHRNIDFSIPQSQFPIEIAPFETVYIDICFAPEKIGKSIDTINFFDVCSNHDLTVIANGIGAEVDSDSPCEIIIRFTPVGFNKEYLFLAASPFPNPVSGNELNILYSKSSPLVETNDESVVLINAMGIEVGQFTRNISESTIKDNLHTEKGVFKLNTEFITSGMYFVLINTKFGSEIKNIIISK